MRSRLDFQPDFPRKSNASLSWNALITEMERVADHETRPKESYPIGEHRDVLFCHHNRTSPNATGWRNGAVSCTINKGGIFLWSGSFFVAKSDSTVRHPTKSSLISLKDIPPWQTSQVHIPGWTVRADIRLNVRADIRLDIRKKSRMSVSNYPCNHGYP